MRASVVRTRSILVVVGMVAALLVGSGGVSSATAAQPLSLRCDTPSEVQGRTPVILVHGFEGSPHDWSKSAQERFAPDVDRACVAVFDYSHVNTRWVTDPAIGRALARLTESLSAASESSGGSGRAALVGYSLGGLAIRCALAADCAGRAVDADRIAGVANIGAPGLGSFWLSPMTAWLAGGVKDLLCSSGATNRFCTLTAALASPAGRALQPGSKELAALAPLPEGIPVYSLAGKVKVITRIFGFPVNISRNLGDLLVDEASASSAPGDATTYDCGTEDVSKLSINSRCWHGTLTVHPGTLERVADFISRTIAGLQPAADGEVAPLMTAVPRKVETDGPAGPSTKPAAPSQPDESETETSAPQE